MFWGPNASFYTIPLSSWQKKKLYMLALVTIFNKLMLSVRDFNVS